MAFLLEILCLWRRQAAEDPGFFFEEWNFITKSMGAAVANAALAWPHSKPCMLVDWLSTRSRIAELCTALRNRLDRPCSLRNRSRLPRLARRPETIAQRL